MHKLKSLATGNFVCFLLLLLCPVASFSQELSESEKEIISYQNTIRLVNKAIEEGRPSDFYLQDNADSRVSFSPPVDVINTDGLVVKPAPGISPPVEVINTDGLVVKPAPGIINLGSFNPAPADCSLFDVWDDGRGICNRFFSHVEAERHYDAALATVAEANKGRDACLNEFAQYKNDQGQEPILPPTSGVKGCEQILQVEGNRDFIYKQSAPIRQAAAGSPITGFRQEPTLIMNVNISSKGRIPILDSNGDQIVSCPWATADGHRGGRARCTAKTPDVRRKAIANTGSPSILFKVNATQCVLVPDAGRCVNSTKGQCDRLIQ